MRIPFGSIRRHKNVIRFDGIRFGGNFTAYLALHNASQRGIDHTPAYYMQNPKFPALGRPRNAGLPSYALKNDVMIRG